MSSSLRALTLREHHVLHAIAYAVPAKEIARYLGVSEATVRTHIRHLQEKLDAHGTAALTRAAVLHDLAGCDVECPPSSK